jgi:hypothetical protein
MWNKQLAARARAYSSGTLTIVESSGYPLSVRCTAQLDDAREIITFPQVPPLAAGWRGKACLLFHRHNDLLEDFYELVIKGELTEVGSTLIMQPTEFVTGTGRQDTDRMPHAGAPLHLIQFMLLGQRNARKYLAKRGTPWPPIHFTDLVQAAKEVEAET